MDRSKDIEQLNRELERVTAERDQFKLIADYASGWEFLCDTKGHFIYMSPSVKNFTGLAEETFIRNSEEFFRLIHPEDVSEVRKYFTETLQFLRMGEVLAFRFFTRSRQQKFAEITMKAVYNQRGDYLGHRGSIYDTTQLMMALGKIDEISAVKQFETESKNKFKDLADSRDRELTTSLLKMAQKNELLQYIKKQLEELKELPGPSQQRIKDLISKISSDVLTQGQWEEFQIYFEKSHPGFFKRLTDQYPHLTTKDLKLCAYLRLQLNTKEISNLMNITPKSTEVSRVRLRKKLKLKRELNLTVFLTRI